MIQLTKEQRREFYKWKYSESMFRQALDTIEYIEANDVTQDHPLHYSLWTSFHIFYGKPFKQYAKLGIRLDEVIIKEEFKGEHDAIITLRDKMYAHSDFEGLETNEVPFNAVIVDVPMKGESITFGFRFINPTDEAIVRYKALCEEAIRKCSYHSQKIWKRISKKLKVARGRSYRLNTQDKSDDFLEPF